MEHLKLPHLRRTAALIGVVVTLSACGAADPEEPAAPSTGDGRPDGIHLAPDAAIEVGRWLRDELLAERPLG